MKEKIALLEPHIQRLTKRATEEGLAVTVVIKPVLCPLDERVAMFDGFFGSMMGHAAGTTAFRTGTDDGPVDDLVARVEKLEARQCRCASRPDSNCACPDPRTWIGAAQPATC